MTSSEVVFNPLLPEFHANPYLFYRRLREEEPVHHSALGIWVLTRYDDVVMAPRDPRFGREGMAELMGSFFTGQWLSPNGGLFIGYPLGDNPLGDDPAALIGDNSHQRPTRE